MEPTRRHLLGAVAVTGLAGPLAGCGGDGDDGDGSGGDGTTSAASTTGAMDMTTAGASATVAVREHAELGEILVDGDGMTLYMFDSDSQGDAASTCTGSCLDAWPPLTTGAAPSAETGVTASLSTFERADGDTQVAANGWPLYYYAPDAAPGDVTGQGVGGVWWVLRPDGTPVRATEPTTAATTTAPPAARVEVATHPDLGEILVDGDGMTLYMFDSDSQGAGESACSGSCADNWPPYTGESFAAGDAVTASLSTFERGDDATQVAADGWPLYYFASDAEPGDANGQGLGDVWWVLRPDGTPVRSSGGAGSTSTATTSTTTTSTTTTSTTTTASTSTTTTSSATMSTTTSTDDSDDGDGGYY